MSNFDTTLVLKPVVVPRLYAKRLEDGEFRWPKVQDGVMRLTAAQLGALLEGLDWRRVHEVRRTRTQVAIA